MAFAAAEWSSTFTIDQDTKEYTGTFNERTRRQELGAGGYSEDIDATLVAHKGQFTAAPKQGRRLSVEGHRYVIAAIDEDSHSLTFHLASTNR